MGRVPNRQRGPWGKAGAAASRVVALLVVLTAGPAAAQLAVQTRPDGVTVTEAGAPVAVYRTRPGPAPAEPWRLHYLHPLVAPDGTVLTEDRPPDHLHQRGVFWAWRRILRDGVQVGDTWVMNDVVYAYRRVRPQRRRDGTVTIAADLDWRGKDGAVLFSETTTLIFAPVTADGSRTLAIRTRLTARQDGLALAGTDDDKGYSGFSVRFVRSDHMRFTSEGRTLTAAVGAVATGDAVTFAWPREPGFPAWEVDVACAVDGRPVRTWVLRRELSMQNCAWPGRTPVAIPRGRPLDLTARIVVRPRSSA